MNRRALLSFGAGLSLSVLTGFRPVGTPAATGRSLEGLLPVDLEPDGLAMTYRRYHLLILGQKDDGKAIAVTQATVAILDRFLPESRSKFIRASDARRVGVLLGTHQQDVAVMDTKSAEALFLAEPPFTDLRKVALRAIVSFGDYLLVCRADYLESHAYLLASTLATHSELLPEPALAPLGAIPAHRGALIYFAGGKIPSD